MIRYLISLVLLLSLSPIATAPISREAPPMTDMPVYVLYCEQDPGRVQAGGGKGPHPQELIESGQCTAAEGVSVTFVMADADWDFEHDDAETAEWLVNENSWFARCDIDANGYCALNSPNGIDVLLGVVLHESTVKSGYVPAFFQRTTHNFTEFAGWGLALIPADESATPDTDVADQQTMALNIMQHSAPANVLTEWVVNEDHADTYLATNREGWVSDIVAAEDVMDIRLVNIAADADMAVACSTIDDGSRLDVYIEGNVLHVSVPDTTSDIRCDVTIAD